MSGYNRVIIAGYVGRDPEVRTSNAGMTIASFTLATGRRTKDGEQWREETDWHRIVAFGKAAEFASQWIRKGKPILVEGKLTSREYEKDGRKQRITEVLADHFHFLPTEKRGERGAGGDVDVDEVEAPPPSAPVGSGGAAPKGSGRRDKGGLSHSDMPF